MWVELMMIRKNLDPQTDIQLEYLSFNEGYGVFIAQSGNT